MTINELIKSAGITMVCWRHHENPNMLDSANMDHWRCVLRAGRARMTVYFSQGHGHHGKAPGLDSVLDCLASDASSVDNSRDFVDWCAELGYSEDSRKAERTFKTIKRQSLKLHRFLGDSAYHTLLFDCERL